MRIERCHRTCLRTRSHRDAAPGTTEWITSERRCLAGVALPRGLVTNAGPVANPGGATKRPDSSPFLAIAESAWHESSAAAFAIPDGHSITLGHTMVVPHREIATWWEASPAERTGLWELVDLFRHRLDAAHQPDGYNVGFNGGVAAAQQFGTCTSM